MTNVHVLPEADLIKHEQTEGCVCGPALEEVRRTAGWIVIHNSLDGRELH